MEVVLGLVAGLGLFLYGMKLMSDGLQKVAGAKMRTVLETLTKNRFMGVIIGFLFTAIIQSSSATTVLEVSFVDSGLMTLSQSVGVTMGANIGTTMTGQLFAFKLSLFAPIILIGGVIMLMFSKKPFVQKLGEVLLGFGMLFFGLETMATSMGGMSSAVQQTIASLDNIYLAVLVGFIATAILQSSSATTGIVMVMAATYTAAGDPLVTLRMSFYLILGCNVGSCVSALIASIPGNKEAKRTAMVHFLFNIFGTLIVVICLGLFEPQIQEMIQTISRNDPRSCVANANTIFKLFQVIILFPLSGFLVKMSRFLIRGEDKVEESEFVLQYIGEAHTTNVTTAVPMATSEIKRMGELAVANLVNALDDWMYEKNDELKLVYQKEEEVDFLNTHISDYLVRVNQLSLPLEDKKILGALFHVVNDIERISDHAENLADFTKICQKDHLVFSKDAKKELQKMQEKVLLLLDYALKTFDTREETYLQDITTLENEINRLERKLQKKHIKRLANGKCEPHAAVIYSDILSNLERVADHGTNIAFAILDKDIEDEEESL